MSSFSPANPSTSNVSDELSQFRLERLLRGAHGAALLGHRLALLDIEAQHRQAWYHSHFNPDQPRVPAGHPDGGQWTRVGAAAGSGTSPVLSDVTPDNDWNLGAQYANNGRGGRGSGPIRTGEQWTEIEPGQAACLTVAEARAQDAIRRVLEFDPNWRLELGTYRTARAGFGPLKRRPCGPRRGSGNSRVVSRHRTFRRNDHPQRGNGMMQRARSRSGLRGVWDE